MCNVPMMKLPLPDLMHHVHIHASPQAPLALLSELQAISASPHHKGLRAQLAALASPPPPAYRTKGRLPDGNADAMQGPSSQLRRRLQHSTTSIPGLPSQRPQALPLLLLLRWQLLLLHLMVLLLLQL